MKASECKCCICGKQAIAFWPIVDPDIPSDAYCRACLDKAKVKFIVKVLHYTEEDAKAIVENRPTQMKIYFYPQGIDLSMYDSYIRTKDAIDNGCGEIHTSSMANFSFDLLDKGYEIYLVSESGHKTKIAPGMPKLSRELRRSHNILKMFLAGVFDHLIYD